jgi:hypothetical protein
MAHWAEIDDNNLVVRVIVASEEFIQSGAVGDPSRWIQTSYNTRSGIHELNGVPLRKNFAGIGSIYHPEHDFFSPPKPHDTSVLDLETGTWRDPIEHPNTRGTADQYRWDPETQNYVLISQ